jgi:hypothetical protein
MKMTELFETQSAQQVRDIFNGFFDLHGSFTVRPDNLIIVYGNCSLTKRIECLPVKFSKVTGDFGCSSQGLTSLVGAPARVGGYFFCSNNNLKSLVGAPVYVEKGVRCYTNPLESLEGFPKELFGSFTCTWSSNLPLLRTLTAKKGVQITDKEYYNDLHPTSDIINQFKGHTNLRHAILDCTKALREAGYEGNAKW